MPAPLCPQFLDGPAGRLFLVHNAPESLDTCVLFLPPFAEEMNKSRRQFALQAQQLRKRGIGSVLVDPGGTGDSEGDLGDALVTSWVEEFQRASEWIFEQGYRSIAIVALRAGALLAAPLLERLQGRVSRLVLWQPQSSGKLVVNQFLRLRSVAGMMAGEGSGESVRDLRASLEAGQPVEVAGYLLSPQFVAGLDALQLGQLADHAGLSIDWFWRGAPEANIAPVDARTMQALAGRNDVREQRFGDEPFWSTVETTVAPSLLSMTTAALVGAAP